MKPYLIGLLSLAAVLGVWMWLHDIEATLSPREAESPGADTEAGLEGRAPVGPEAPASDSVPVRVEHPVGPLVRYEGQVVDKTGKPVGGAQVDVFGPDVVEGVVTDEDGRFAVDVRAGRYEVSARTPDGETFREQNVLVAEASVGGDVLRVDESHPLRIRFTLGRRPLADVHVTVYGGYDWHRPAEMRGAHPIAETTSDVDGQAIFDDLAPGLYELAIRLPFGATFRTSRRHRSHDEYLIDLPRLAEIAGRVTNGVDGPGVAGASVAFRCQDHERLHGLVVTTTTDADGYYVARAPAAAYAQYWSGHVTAPGFWEWRSHLPRADGAKGTINSRHGRRVDGIDVVLLLKGRAQVVGRVVTEDGSGVGGVVVAVRSSAWRPSYPDVLRVRAQPDGSFTLDGLKHPRGYVCTVRDPDWIAEASPQEVYIRSDDADPAVVLIEVTPAASLSGRVIDAEGRGVAGARVWVDKRQWRGFVPANGPWPGEVHTNEEGRWMVGGLDPSRRYLVEAVWRDQRSERHIWSPKGRAGETNDLRLDAAVTLRGAVRDLSGEGIPFDRFYLRPAPWKQGHRNLWLVPLRVDCDAEGRFEVTSLPSEDWHVVRHLSSKDYERVNLLGESGLVEKTIWRDRLKIRGRVADPDGNPVVAHGSLRGRSNDRMVKDRQQTRDDGRFEFAVPGEGTYNIGFVAPGYEPGSATDLVGGEDDIVVTLTPKR